MATMQHFAMATSGQRRRTRTVMMYDDVDDDGRRWWTIRNEGYLQRM